MLRETESSRMVFLESRREQVGGRKCTSGKENGGIQNRFKRGMRKKKSYEYLPWLATSTL